VPGDEWAPAWVDWRYGDDNVGWAPLPPDDLIDTYDEQPDNWVFVPLRYIGEPEMRRYYVPRDRRMVILRESRLINRPVHVEGRRLWVNPGLAPGFITGRTHVALHPYQVRPRVFGATTGVQGALTVRKEDLRIKGAVRRAAPVTVRPTTAVIQATTSTAAPQPLNKGEHGRLGSQPPRAAQGGATPQLQQQTAPSGAPPRVGTPPVQHTGPAPAIVPAPAPAQPKVLEERREVHPPAGAGGPPSQPGVVQPAPHPAPPPPAVVHTPPPPPPAHTPAPPPPAAVHAPPPPPPPVVHAPPPPPPPVVHAPPPPPPPAARAPPPPPPAVHAPPPAAKPAAPATKPAEVPK
jgi:hypothetical protein